MPTVVRALLLLLLVLTGTILGVLFSHLVQARAKAGLSLEELLIVQGDLYGDVSSSSAPLELTCLAVAMALAFLMRHDARAAGLLGLAAAGLLVLVAMWALAIVPLDRAIAGWSTVGAPADWPAVRDRWHAQQAIRFVLALISFLAVAWSLFPRPQVLDRLQAAHVAKRRERQAQREQRRRSQSSED
jgi:hypothetical protein